MSVIDLFSGPDGWGMGLRLLGRTDVFGIDSDSAAVATARAAGHHVRQAVLGRHPSVYVDTSWRPEGIVASPPCPGFSAAGLKAGIGDIPMLLAEVRSQINRGNSMDLAIERTLAWQQDSRSALSLEPLRWVCDLQPEWTTWEQVPTVLPLWEACAEVLRGRGYSVWTGKVHSEQFGVPQARTRAVLIARLDGLAGGYNAEYLAPLPTHSRYHRRLPQLMDPRVLPWVSMADALGPEWVPEAANDGTTLEDMQWVFNRPSPTIVGSFRPDVVAKPAYRKAGDTPRQKAPGSVLVTVQQAAVLQSFPADYPWQGSEAAQRRQIGDAIPPLLARASLRGAGVSDLNE